MTTARLAASPSRRFRRGEPSVFAHVVRRCGTIESSRRSARLGAVLAVAVPLPPLLPLLLLLLLLRLSKNWACQGGVGSSRSNCVVAVAVLGPKICPFPGHLLACRLAFDEVAVSARYSGRRPPLASIAAIDIDFLLPAWRCLTKLSWLWVSSEEALMVPP